MKLERPIERFDEIYQIYKESFPDIEQRTMEGQKKVVENPMYRVRVEEEDGRILAFVGYWELNNSFFIEHLATTGKCRNKGYGKKLVKECLEEAQSMGKPVFLEIEPIADNDSMTGRRARFYRRLGFCLNDFPYEQLPLKAGDKPCRLCIMSYGLQVSAQEFEPYKEEIYHIVYGK